MKKLSLSLFVAFALCTAAAVAQAGGAQGTQGSSPGMSQPGQQPGTAQPGDASGGSMGQTQTDQTSNPNQNKPEKGEKKLKGCVQSQGGQYVLETKKGKAVALTGQDVSAHVGHEVSVKGTWESGGGAGTSSASSGKAAGSEKTFNVSSVDMISDSCGGKSKGSSGSMGTAPSSTTSPSGAGSTNPPENNPPPSNPPQNNPPESNPPQ